MKNQWVWGVVSVTSFFVGFLLSKSFVIPPGKTPPHDIYGLVSAARSQGMKIYVISSRDDGDITEGCYLSRRPLDRAVVQHLVIGNHNWRGVVLVELSNKVPSSDNPVCCVGKFVMSGDTSLAQEIASILED